MYVEMSDGKACAGKPESKSACTTKLLRIVPGPALNTTAGSIGDLTNVAMPQICCVIMDALRGRIWTLAVLLYTTRDNRKKKLVLHIRM